jgi:hypothetical protein
MRLTIMYKEENVTRHSSKGPATRHRQLADGRILRLSYKRCL